MTTELIVILYNNAHFVTKLTFMLFCE
jgi:hypothetical protein